MLCIALHEGIDVFIVIDDITREINIQAIIPAIILDVDNKNKKAARDGRVDFCCMCSGKSRFLICCK
ncbi:MAG: hypothetical protein KKD47_09695 [Proteobacteria bacterium]|nr:hypothetical protein [Pseudomonadota bacterium]